MEKVQILGMELDEWKYKSCTAHFGTGKKWATLYDIKSKEEGKGHATVLLIQAKKYYEKKGKTVRSTEPLCADMEHILLKLKIPIA